MELIFALLVLVLLVLGLRNRKKEKKEYLKEERYEESGAWIDKRVGERGTYGSLDEEMESNRKYIARQSKVSALAQQVQAYCFTELPSFHLRDDAGIKQHLNYCKSLLDDLFVQIEALGQGRALVFSPAELTERAIRPGLKKKILDFCFEEYPQLLEAEIEEIKRFEQLAEQIAERILAEGD